MSIVDGYLFLSVLAAVYFTPSLVGWQRHARSLDAVILVNLLFGWTVIGWAAALVMAVKMPPAPRR
jgi:Superinfection immunity protein